MLTDPDADLGVTKSTVALEPGIADLGIADKAAWRSVVATAISAERTIRYSVIETEKTFAHDGPLASVIRGVAGTVLVVIDSAVWRIAAKEIGAYLAEATTSHRIVVLPGGEQNKTLKRALEIVDAMDQSNTPRRSAPVIAIGGGVICDLVGFAASIYRRGVPYFRVPTTLLSQVDVSVAIKTGVNRGGYRNRIGAFWPAELTLIDRSFLSSQSRVEISHGLGEVFKLALIKSEPLFGQLERIPHGWSPEWLSIDESAAKLMRLAIEEMAVELRADLWEDDLARCVDFGHSFSPLIEMRNGIHHGHAVALDCLLSLCIAINRGLINRQYLDRAVAVMLRCALPTGHVDFANIELLW